MTSDVEQLSNRLRREVFLPALQDAVRRAREQDPSGAAILNAAVMTFGDMLIEVVGATDTVRLLRGFADHIERTLPQQDQAAAPQG